MVCSTAAVLALRVSWIAAIRSRFKLFESFPKRLGNLVYAVIRPYFNGRQSLYRRKSTRHPALIHSIIKPLTYSDLVLVLYTINLK